MAGVQLGQDFYALATHLGKAADARLRAFQAWLADAPSGVSGWSALPAVIFGVVIVLAVAEVWRRLAEYR